jgi:hypothetical protein
MNTGLKKVVLQLATIIILIGFLMANIEATLSESTGARIDIFTQKEPHSGRGLNASSDAFGPDEEVIIYAFVTFNNYPETNALVAFEVDGPKNPLENVTLYDIAETNGSGFAEMRFRTGLNNLTNFGAWIAVGSVRIADSIVQDFLYFRVGWIVEIKSIKTISENHIEQTEFSKGGSVGIELTLLNIAMTEKTAVIAITLYDSSNHTVNSTEIDNFVVPANGTLVYASYFLYIPMTASSGEAVADACAYTTSISGKRVPYSPKVSRHFWIIPVHDVAVLSVVPSSSLVYIGDVLNVDVIVKNKGSEVESFNVTLYHNSSTVGILRVDSLAAGSEYTLTFHWNTSAVPEGNYTMSASAPLLYDVTPLDNTLVDGVVQVKARPPPAIKWYTLTITATAGGTTDPAPGLYNYISGATVEVKAIPGTNYTLDHWELDNISVGSVNPYLVLMDGNHTLKAIFSVTPTRPLIPEMLLLCLLIGLAVLVGICVIFALLFGLWWRRRKRKKRRSAQLNSGRVGFPKTKTCSVCGKQFNGVHTFCPYCFAFHGKDY